MSPKQKLCLNCQKELLLNSYHPHHHVMGMMVISDYNDNDQNDDDGDGDGDVLLVETSN